MHLQNHFVVITEFRYAILWMIIAFNFQFPYVCILELFYCILNRNQVSFLEVISYQFMQYFHYVRKKRIDFFVLNMNMIQVNKATISKIIIESLLKMEQNKKKLQLKILTSSQRVMVLDSFRQEKKCRQQKAESTLMSQYTSQLLIKINGYQLFRELHNRFKYPFLNENS